MNWKTFSQVHFGTDSSELSSGQFRDGMWSARRALQVIGFKGRNCHYKYVAAQIPHYVGKIMNFWNKNKKGKFLPHKSRGLRMKKQINWKSTLKFDWYVLTLTEVFVNQKKTLCEHTVKLEI